MEERSSIGLAVLLLAVLAVGIAGINSYFAFTKYSQISTLTGFTGSAGYVNITVASVVSINFTKDAILWGAGSINNGELNATLFAVGGGSSTVTRGNWSTTGITPLALDNIGSVNVSLRIATSNNDSSLFGGSIGHRAYKLNFSNSDAAACLNDTINLHLTWYDANATASGTKICSHLGFLDTQDQINISVWLTVPYDGNTSALTSTVTATAATAG